MPGTSPFSTSQFRYHFAADTLQFTPRERPKGSITPNDNHLDILRLPCDASTVLARVAITLDAADVQFGLIGVNITL